jgi:hypothetical protein
MAFSFAPFNAGHTPEQTDAGNNDERLADLDGSPQAASRDETKPASVGGRTPGAIL